MKLKELFDRFHMVLGYLGHSILSTVVDTALVWILLDKAGVPLVAANTAGVVAGFILGFFLDVRRTFRSKYTPLTFAVYLVTFLMGLVLANALIAVSYRWAIGLLPEGLAFLFSKGVSIAVPFFALYYIRKAAYGWVKKWEEQRK